MARVTGAVARSGTAGRGTTVDGRPWGEREAAVIGFGAVAVASHPAGGGNAGAAPQVATPPADLQQKIKTTLRKFLFFWGLFF